MTELKTLKDIAIKQRNPQMNIAYQDDLRAEAIKWIKAFRNRNWRTRNKDIPLFKHTEDIEEWIKYNYDITEEELK